MQIHIGKSLVFLMDCQDITRADIAKKLQVSPQRVTTLTQQENCNTKMLNALADIFSIDVVDFLQAADEYDLVFEEW